MAQLAITETSLRAFPRPIKIAQDWIWCTALPGFTACVARTGRVTFYAATRVRGKKAKVLIGVHGHPNKDGQLWTVALAKEAAKTLIGAMATGVVPLSPSAKQSGPTLRDALIAHVAFMRAKRLEDRSIADLEYGITKYLASWLDRPIADLSVPGVLLGIYNGIKDKAKARAGSNPQNTKGSPTAIRTMRQLSACWNSLNRAHHGAIGDYNPVRAVPIETLKPKRAPMAPHELPVWWSKVQTLSPIRRDFAILCLFTGMRSEAARAIEWAHVDLARRVLRVPSPKGGTDMAFDLPLGPTLVELFKRRKAENPIIMLQHGGDHGFAFPSVTRARNEDGSYTVQPIAEAKEYRNGVKYMTGPHVSRYTYDTVGHEAGVSELDRSVLMNHSFGSHSVNEQYIRQSMPHLMECQETIDAALQKRIKVPKRSGLVMLKAAPRATVKPLAKRGKVRR